MVRSDQFLGGFILSCFFILHDVTNARRYNCTTQDGRQGVCVVKRYCRGAINEPLLPCDEDNHCCHIPTSQSSVPPRAPEKPLESGRTWSEQDGANRQRPEPPRAPEKSLESGSPTIDQDERNGQRPELSRGSENSVEVVRPWTTQDGRNRQRPELPRAPEKTLGVGRPWTAQDERNRQRPDLPRAQEKPRNDDRPRTTEMDERYQGLPERDDRLNKTPPPGDSKSPTRHQADRPKQASRDRSQEDAYEHERRRPPKTHGNQPQGDRHRHRNDDESVSRPASSHPVDQDRRDSPVQRPNNERFYPSREQLDLHHKPHSSWRPKPDRKNDSLDALKDPIRFPESYESSVTRPKVPACGVKPFELFIAGGSESEKHEWPWMTAIFRRHPDTRPKTFLCGGSLVNTKYVLTAAHCLINNYVLLPASSFVVRLGSHFLDSGEEYTVSSLVVHHNHSGSDFFNDIALVRLASEVFITDKIAPICLPSPDMLRDNLVGKMATVAGWGDTSFRSSGDRLLRHVTLPIVSGDECSSAYSRVQGAAFLARGSDYVVCAGLMEGGKDACLGDSGGPLMLKMSDDRWFVVGIVSLGYKCAEPGYPGVYTRVTHYLSWIDTNMKRH